MFTVLLLYLYSAAIKHIGNVLFCLVISLHHLTMQQCGLIHWGHFLCFKCSIIQGEYGCLCQLPGSSFYSKWTRHHLFLCTKEGFSQESHFVYTTKTHKHSYELNVNEPLLVSNSNRCSFPLQCDCCCGPSPWSLQSLCPFSWVASPSELGLSHDAFWQQGTNTQIEKKDAQEGTKWTKGRVDNSINAQTQLSNCTVHCKDP